MTVFVGLLRAVNVGGTGKLPMTALKEMCETAGFTRVETYIASGNVVFETRATEATVKARLERSLEAYAGRPVGVLIRTSKEMASVLAANPFPQAPPTQVVTVFLDAPPPADVLAGVTGRADEEIRLGVREIYVRYPGGQGRSKLKIRAGAAGTARNLNTVARLVGMSSKAD